MEYSIRAASVEDCKDIRRMIGELAEYEKATDEVTITQRDLERDGFSENPLYNCVVAEVPEQHKTEEGRHEEWSTTTLLPVASHSGMDTLLSAMTATCRRFSSYGHTKIGYATYFYNFSTWCGRAIYMGDLYVMSEFRGKGVGRALMSKVAQLGLAAGCHQLNFSALDWNKPAQGFYLRQGCVDITASTGKHFMRCEGEALEHLAQP